jgi:hypothetical protein
MSVPPFLGGPLDGSTTYAPESRPYGGTWDGPVFVLTHHPEDAVTADDVTFLTCEVAEAVRIALEAAGGKNVEITRRRSGDNSSRDPALDGPSRHRAR